MADRKGINGRRMFLGFGFNNKKRVHINQTRPESVRFAKNLEESRYSIEVFGSGATSKGEVAESMERKLSMLTWGAIPKAQNSGDDTASDASSDLFEIDVTADDASICMSPASHYAPSEASIPWSVVTDSTVEYSAASDYDDVTSVRKKEVRKGWRGGILGCRRRKAVDVAENVNCKNLDRAAKHHLTTVDLRSYINQLNR